AGRTAPAGGDGSERLSAVRALEHALMVAGDCPNGHGCSILSAHRSRFLPRGVVVVATGAYPGRRSLFCYLEAPPCPRPSASTSAPPTPSSASSRPAIPS